MFEEKYSTFWTQTYNNVVLFTRYSYIIVLGKTPQTTTNYFDKYLT